MRTGGVPSEDGWLGWLPVTFFFFPSDEELQPHNRTFSIYPPLLSLFKVYPLGLTPHTLIYVYIPTLHHPQAHLYALINLSICVPLPRIPLLPHVSSKTGLFFLSLLPLAKRRTGFYRRIRPTQVRFACSWSGEEQKLRGCRLTVYA